VKDVIYSKKKSFHQSPVTESNGYYKTNTLWDGISQYRFQAYLSWWK